MITSFTARNFRCFRDFTIEPLERFNLIAGRNNSGKTCLLEGLYLLAWGGMPDPVLGIDRFRGMPDPSGDPDAAWGWLFGTKNRSEPIALSARRDLGPVNGDASSLTIEDVPATQYAMVAGRPGIEEAASVRELRLTFRAPEREAAGSRLVLSSQGPPQAELFGQPTAVGAAFVTTSVRMGPAGVRVFSQLQQVQAEGPIVEILRLLDPRVERLAVLAPTPEPVIYADIGIGRLVPLPLLGDGPTRVVQMMLAVEQARGGVVLIDEIDNGLHYAAVQALWTKLRAAAHAADVQVFATTHSWECICAAHEAFSATAEYDFRLQRLDRVNGDIEAVDYDRETLDAAIGGGIEVR